MNTKTIARQTGKSVAAVNDLMRDLDLPRHYDSVNRCWRVERSSDAKALIVQLSGE
jgi:hypothetical protein